MPVCGAELMMRRAKPVEGSFWVWDVFSASFSSYIPWGFAKTVPAFPSAMLRATQCWYKGGYLPHHLNLGDAHPVTCTWSVSGGQELHGIITKLESIFVREDVIRPIWSLRTMWPCLGTPGGRCTPGLQGLEQEGQGAFCPAFLLAGVATTDPAHPKHELQSGTSWRGWSNSALRPPGRVLCSAVRLLLAAAWDAGGNEHKAADYFPNCCVVSITTLFFCAEWQLDCRVLFNFTILASPSPIRAIISQQKHGLLSAGPVCQVSYS